jgi:hypothetical protein
MQTVRRQSEFVAIPGSLTRWFLCASARRLEISTKNQIHQLRALRATKFLFFPAPQLNLRAA